MSERYLVLGALVRQGPASVAELHEFVYERSGFLSLDDGVVERAVIELCAEGLIKGTGEMRSGTARPRERVVYAATNSGSIELDRWIREPPSQSVIEATLPSNDWIPEEITDVAQVDALIAEAARREARARRDLGDNRHISSEAISAENQPWSEFTRVMVHNYEVTRLEGEIEALVWLQAELRDFRAELQATEG